MEPFVDSHTHHRRLPEGTIALYSVRAGIDNGTECGTSANGTECGRGGGVVDADTIKKIPYRPFSVGIHPWDAHLYDISATAGSLGMTGNLGTANETNETGVAGGTGTTGAAGMTGAAGGTESPLALLEKFIPLGPAAIGEIGIDTLHIRKFSTGALPYGDARQLENIDSQQELLRRQQALLRLQLDLAQRLRLPVIIHSVRALHLVLPVLDDFHGVTALFHGFTGNRQQAERIVRHGGYISASPTTLRSPKSLDALRNLPPQRLMLETDDSECTIQEVYNTAASALAIPLETLTRQLYTNFNQLFNPHGTLQLDSTH